jgi:hypothetical protein
MSSNVFASNVWYSGNVIVSQTLNGALGTLSATPAAAANVLTVIGSSTTGNVVQFSNSAGGRFVMTSGGNVGLGVSNPVQALEVAGSAVVAGTLSAGNPLMFRNRIINGDMRIAQRGTSSTSTTSTNLFIIDRFLVGSSITTGVITYSQNTLTTSDTPYQYGFRYAANFVATTACSSFGYIEIATKLEGYSIDDFMWGTPYGATVTLSFWYRSNMPVGSTTNITLRNNNISTTYIATFITTGTWQYLTFTIPPPPNTTTFNTGSNGALEIMISPLASLNSSIGWVGSTATRYSGSYNWAATLNTYIQFTAVQLEKGTVATPFEVRPFGTELALCQRYYEVGPYQDIWKFYSTTQGSLQGTFKVVKRAIPTLSFSSSIFAVLPNSGAAPIQNGLVNSVGTITLGSGNFIGTASFIADFTNTTGVGGATAGDTRFVYVGSGGVWNASAEL